MIDFNPLTRSTGGNRFVRGLNPFNRGSLGQDLAIQALVENSPLPQNVKNLIMGGIGIKEVASIPFVGKPLVGAGALLLGEGAFRPVNRRSLKEEMALVNETLNPDKTNENEPRLAGDAVKPPVPTFDPPALANQPPSPNNPSPAPSTQPPAPAPSTQPPASPNTPNNSATPSPTGPIPLEVIPAPESEPQRFSAEAMQETKNDLYDRARAKAVQSGKQEDLDVVRDLGLAMHAKNFPNMGGIRDDLDLNEQRNRAKDFLTASIA